MVKDYDPKKVIITFGGVPLAGFADGTFVSISANDSDGFKKQVGADGEVVRSKSNDNTHGVEVTLLQSSLSNNYLSGIRATDKITGKAKLPLSITDLNGLSLHFWPQAWIKGDPDWDYGKEASERKWSFDTGQEAADNKGGYAI